MSCDVTSLYLSCSLSEACCSQNSNCVLRVTNGNFSHSFFLKIITIVDILCQALKTYWYFNWIDFDNNLLNKNQFEKKKRKTFKPNFYYNKNNLFLMQQNIKVKSSCLSNKIYSIAAT